MGRVRAAEPGERDTLGSEPLVTRSQSSSSGLTPWAASLLAPRPRWAPPPRLQAPSGCSLEPATLPPQRGVEEMAAAPGDRSTLCDNDMPPGHPLLQLPNNHVSPQVGRLRLPDKGPWEAGWTWTRPRRLSRGACLSATALPAPPSCFGAGGAAINCVHAHRGALSCHRP